VSAQRDKPDSLRRSLRTGVVITSLIGTATAVYSFHDALIVTHHAGEHGRYAYLVPLFADGLIAFCSSALYAGAQAKVRRPFWATAGLMFGIAVTVLMNVAAGWLTGPVLALIDALAPVVFLIALEILVWEFRLGRPGQPGDKPAQCPHGVPSSVDEAVRLDFEHRRDCLGEKPSYLQHGARWGIDRRRVPELIGIAEGGERHGERREGQASADAAQERAAGQVAAVDRQGRRQGRRQGQVVMSGAGGVLAGAPGNAALNGDGHG
jgi:hypothetical protein